MTLVLREPFVDAGAWQTQAGTPTFVTGRTGTAVQLDSNADSLAHTVAVANESNVFTCGMAFRTSVLVDNLTILHFYGDNNTVRHVFIKSRSDGKLELMRSTTSLAATSAGMIAVNTWYYIEMQALLSDTVGYVIVRVNGTEVINVTGVDTKNAGTKTVFDTVTLWPTFVGATCLYDDLYIKTGAGETFLGDITITEQRVARISSRLLTSGTPAAQLARISARALTALGVIEAQLAQISLRALATIIPEPSEIYAGTAPLRIWSSSNEGVAACVGRVIVRDGIAGTTVLDVDSRMAQGSNLNGFAARSGQAITVTEPVGGEHVIEPIADVLYARFDAEDYPPGDPSSYTDPRGRLWTLSEPGAVVYEVDEIPAVLVPGTGDVCPVRWERPFARAEIATRVILQRESDDELLTVERQYDDQTGQVLYGVEPFERRDLVTKLDADLDIIGERLLTVRSYRNAPKVRTVTVDARTSNGALDLMTLVDPYKPSRYRCRHSSGGRTIFDGEYFATGVRHRLTRDEWSTEIALDLASPFMTTTEDRWSRARWDQSHWAEAV